MSATFRIENSESREQVDMEVIRQGMRAHAVQHVEWETYVDLTLYVRDENDQLVGAFLGETGRGWLRVSVMWVLEKFRGQGLGAQLLTAGEAEAHKRGCHHAYLDTFDYQAPFFYQRQGYEIFGTLEGYPESHRRYFMRKTLKPTTPS